jgi:hypothetical protein
MNAILFYRRVVFVLVFSSVLPVGVAFGESLPNLIKAGIDALCADFAAIVSKAEGNFTSRNPFGCLGAFQFCPATFIQYFAGTTDEFLNNPKAQTAAWTQYEKNQWSLAKKNGLTNIIGNVIEFAPPIGPTKITASAILMACQFGCGKFGKLANYVSRGDCSASNVKDGNGVSVCTYLAKGAGQNVSCFTSEPPDVSVKPTTVVAKPENPTKPEAALTKPSELLPTPQFAPTTSCPDFGKDGPLEVLVGRYTLRFGSTASPDSIKKYLGVLKE